MSRSSTESGGSVRVLAVVHRRTRVGADRVEPVRADAGRAARAGGRRIRVRLVGRELDHALDRPRLGEVLLAREARERTAQVQPPTACARRDRRRDRVGDVDQVHVRLGDHRRRVVLRLGEAGERQVIAQAVEAVLRVDVERVTAIARANRDVEPGLAARAQERHVRRAVETPCRSRPGASPGVHCRARRIRRP